MLGRLSVYIYIIADVFYAFSSLFGEEEKMIGQERTMTCQGYLVFHPLSSVKECQVRTNTLSFIILTLILIILPIVIILVDHPHHPHHPYPSLHPHTPHTPHNPYAEYERVSVRDKHVVSPTTDRKK